MVNMNAATSVITTKSPYMVRTSFTVFQLNEALIHQAVVSQLAGRRLGNHATQKRGAVAGHDAMV